jgi:hypothetical protein
MTDKEQIKAEVEKELSPISKRLKRDSKDPWEKDVFASQILNRLLSFINSMQEESVASIWHDTSETPKIGEYIVLAYKSKVVSSYIYEPKLLAGVWKHAVKWAYVDDLINL